VISWEDKTPDALTRPLSRRASDGVDADDGFTVVFRDACRNAIYAHISPSISERGGLLLGIPWHDDANTDVLRIVDVVESVAAEQSSGTPVSLSMGPQVWSAARERCNASGGELMVVGWYHSHPGLTAFFSGTDRRTQAAFFRESWHLGLCVDPASDDEAWFRGADSEAVSPGSIVLADG